MNAESPAYRFELLDHTADQTIAAYGETLEECFEAAAAGMFSLSVDLATVPAEKSWAVKVQAPALPDLLARWLKELLFISEQEEAALSRFRITALELGPWRLEGTAWGAPFSDKVRRTGAVAKAVTYQNLAVEATAEGWRATVTVDV